MTDEEKTDNLFRFYLHSFQDERREAESAMRSSPLWGAETTDER
jgi:hypothetical protein